jgi:transcription initiation factor TFIIIB Brf1 subunit/transcription initiation factor TFIIB
MEETAIENDNKVLPSKSLNIRISERIEKYGLPKNWEKECYVLCEKFLESHPKQRFGNIRKLIDSVLFLLCRRYHVIEPLELKYAASGHYYFRVLEELDGVIRATPEDYVRKFFNKSGYPNEFLLKALDIASKLPHGNFQAKNPRNLASACIYVASIEKTSNGYRALVTQPELAEFFKVTVVSIRGIYKELIPKLRELNTMLSKEEIEWWLSFSKEQSEKV